MTKSNELSKLAKILEKYDREQHGLPQKASKSSRRRASSASVGQQKRGSKRSRAGSSGASRQVATVAFRLTLRSPAVERYHDPYCDDMDGIFGNPADFAEGKQVDTFESFEEALDAGWAAVQEYVDAGCPP